MSTDPTDGSAARRSSGAAMQPDAPPEQTSDTAAYAPGEPARPYPPQMGYAPPGPYLPQGQYAPQGQYGPPGHYQQHDGGPGFGDRASQAMTNIGRHVKTPETKEFFKTSEFGVWLFTVVALVIAGAVIDASSHNDVMRADLVWKLVAGISAVYILSRGIAKAGTRRGYGDRPMDRT